MAFSSSSQPRGLHNFILDIRNAPSKEAEVTRVETELQKIRQKFSNPGTLNAYNRKKYCWKLVYIYMLGYTVDFGHMEMINLLSSQSFKDKAVGYMAITLLFRPGDDMMTLVVNSVRNDLIQTYSTAAQCLALGCIANLGGEDFAESVSADVQRILLSNDSDVFMRKRAVLCLLRLFKANPDCLSISEWADRMASLLEHRHLGFINSTLSFLNALAEYATADFEGMIPFIIQILYTLICQRSCPNEYVYYKSCCPWIQVKCLQFLQKYDMPEEETPRGKLLEVLRRVITHTEASSSINKTNADHAVLFETVNTVVSYGLECEETLRLQTLDLLGRFVSVKDGNARYLGLDGLAQLARVSGPSSIQQFRDTVFLSFKDADVSVRRKALDVLFVMADETNTKAIVSELMVILPSIIEQSLKEEIYLKVAIMSEKYCGKDLCWYIDVMSDLISIVGDDISPSLWYRIVQVITNFDDLTANGSSSEELTHPEETSLQAYASKRLFQLIKSKRASETSICLGAYVLGEFGFRIAEEAGFSAESQFHALAHHLKTLASVTTSASEVPLPSQSGSSNASGSSGGGGGQFGNMTKSIILSTFAKMNNLYPELRPKIAPLLQRFSAHHNIEVQQRALEYSLLPTLGDDMMDEILKEMPLFEMDGESALEQVLAARGGRGRSNSTYQEDKEDDEDYEDEDDDYSSPAKKQAPAEIDLLNMDEPSFNSSSSSSLLNETFDPSMHQQLKDWFLEGLEKEQFLLFQNDLLQVGVRQQVQGIEGRSLLFIRNRLADAPLTNVDVHLLSEDTEDSVRQLLLQGLNNQENTASSFVSSEFASSPSSPSHLPLGSLEPGAQGKAQIIVQCHDVPSTGSEERTDVRSQAPPLVVRCTLPESQGTVCLLLHLPILPSSFCQPVNMDKGAYMAKWKGLGGEDELGGSLQAQHQFSYQSADSGNEGEKLQAIKQSIEVHLLGRETASTTSIIPDMDPQTPQTITFCFTFHSNGHNPIGVLARVEHSREHQAFRVTVRSSSSLFASAFSEELKMLVLGFMED